LLKQKQRMTEHMQTSKRLNNMRHFISIITVLLVSLTLQAQTSQKSPHFKVDITDMNPLRFQSKNLSPGFTMELRNDSAIVYLPYMGEVFTPSMNPDERLDYAQPYTDFKSFRNKKGTADCYRFKVKRGTIVYNFLVTKYDEGKIYIDLIPSNATACSYTGNLHEE
jgi:hypothetical protein